MKSESRNEGWWGVKEKKIKKNLMMWIFFVFLFWSVVYVGATGQQYIASRGPTTPTSSTNQPTLNPLNLPLPPRPSSSNSSNPTRYAIQRTLTNQTRTLSRAQCTQSIPIRCDHHPTNQSSHHGCYPSITVIHPFLGTFFNRGWCSWRQG